METICQPFLRLPSTTTYSRSNRSSSVAFVSRSPARLEASFKLSHRAVAVRKCQRSKVPLCFSGIRKFLYTAAEVGFSPQKKTFNWYGKRKRGVPRCEIATGAQVPQSSGSGWDQNVVPFSGPTVGQRIRAFGFYLTTYVVAFPLFFVMLLIQPAVLLFDKYKRRAQHFINKIWASLTILLFYKVEIEGLENLPSPDEAAVYVSNHQSFLDIYTLFLLGRPFKFISKTSNFLIPIIGWSMYLTGHVPIRRMDTRSQMECLRHCINLVKNGVSVFFFPEGTRSRDGKMGYFKRGAFTIAAKTNVPVVPVTLIGTGKLMPNGFEGTLRPGTVKVIVHPPIRGTNADELCQQSRDTISKSLLQHGLEVHSGC